MVVGLSPFPCKSGARESRRPCQGRTTGVGRGPNPLAARSGIGDDEGSERGLRRVIMKLLVITDLQENADAFLAEAREWAVRLADEAWIVHVEDPDPAFVGYDAGPQEVRDSVANEIRRHHDRLEEEADRWGELGLETVALTIQGPVVDTLLEEAARLGVDAIVMGAPTHGRWHDLLLGNVADSLIRKARCPVLVIPATENAPPTPLEGFGGASGELEMIR